MHCVKARLRCTRWVHRHLIEILLVVCFIGCLCFVAQECSAEHSELSTSLCGWASLLPLNFESEILNFTGRDLFFWSVSPWWACVFQRCSWASLSFCSSKPSEEHNQQCWQLFFFREERIVKLNPEVENQNMKALLETFQLDMARQEKRSVKQALQSLFNDKNRALILQGCADAMERHFKCECCKLWCTNVFWNWHCCFIFRNQWKTVWSWQLHFGKKCRNILEFGESSCNSAMKSSMVWMLEVTVKMLTCSLAASQRKVKIVQQKTILWICFGLFLPCCLNDKTFCFLRCFSFSNFSHKLGAFLPQKQPAWMLTTQMIHCFHPGLETSGSFCFLLLLVDLSIGDAIATAHELGPSTLLIFCTISSSYSTTVVGSYLNLFSPVAVAGQRAILPIRQAWFNSSYEHLPRTTLLFLC